MNPQWNTPPNGDFAKYVEQLSAQAALPHRAPPAGEHRLDEGIQPSAPAAPAAQLPATSPGEVPRRAPATAAASDSSARTGLAKTVVIAFSVLLLALLSAGVPFGVVVLVFVAGLWLAHQMRRLIFPPGIDSWQQWLDSIARAQRQARQKATPSQGRGPG